VARLIGHLEDRGAPGHRPNGDRGPNADIGAVTPALVRPSGLTGWFEQVRRPLCNDRKETLHFFSQARDRLAIAGEDAQQAALEKSVNSA
jgi:hypothetical protein